MLQASLDASFASSGPHMRSIITGERRVDAETLAGRLRGMSLLVLATTTRDGRPIAGPVDGIFHRGSFHFGSARNSVKARHIATRPHVSATHLPAEEFAVTVHGRAVPIDVRAPEGASLRANLLEIYVPRYGAAWEHDFLDGGSDPDRAPVYWRIVADRIFTFQMDH